METAVGFRVRYQSVTLFVLLVGPFQKRLCAFGEIVFIDEVFAGVIGRVDVDHLDLPEVGLLEEFECVQVVALDEEVLGGVEIHALLPAGA